MVKLYRKLSFHGHLCFRPVLPESIYLKVKNSNYKIITININTLPTDLTDFVDHVRLIVLA